MCGIFGVACDNNKGGIRADKLKSFSALLFKLSDSRGKEASGIALRREGHIAVYRQPVRGSRLIKSKTYDLLFSPDKIVTSFIGHSRLATNGLQTDNRNNQPVFDSGGAVVHNGIIVNDKKLWKSVLHSKPKNDVDTEVILKLINYYYNKGFSLAHAVQKLFSLIEGSATIAFYSAKEPLLILASNTGSLYYSKTKAGFIFASESYILKKFIEKANIGSPEKLSHLASQTGICLNLNNLEFYKFGLKERINPINLGSLKTAIFRVEEVKGLPEDGKTLNIINNSYNNSLSKLKKHNFDYRKIYELRRCTKCVLPETMPFIRFNEEGVCNYCTNYQKIIYKGRADLESTLKEYRRNDGKPDCVLAFSGGRDSSYGLHYLKKEMRMNPVAYTYDWGMVTDLARRNQARLLGKLGIEHIIVSADISFKRDNIRKNILAWSQKPDLGMVPLFMAGDKPAEYYADSVAKHLGIKLVIYCSGCGMENDVFKAGLAGVKNGYPAGILHNLSKPGRLKLASYYIRQIIKNPRYINSSMGDTVFAYFTTYVKSHNYLYFWYYIPWNEDKILSTLRNEYNWESAAEGTNLTWRTDDGSPAFYNYIYYQTLGLTENDTFRSNQIREGQITRTKALSLVKEENKPRYGALKWYFDVLGVSGDEILTVVDNIPRRY